VKERVERFEMPAVVDARCVEDQRAHARGRARVHGLEATRHETVPCRERHPQRSALVRHARHAEPRDHAGERIEPLRLAARADRDEPVELGLVRAIAAQHFRLRQPERAHELAAER
jgi:hypothetical protein